MLESKTNKDIEGCVRTSFTSQRKEVLSLVEETSTLGNCSDSGNVSPQRYKQEIMTI